MPVSTGMSPRPSLVTAAMARFHAASGSRRSRRFATIGGGRLGALRGAAGPVACGKDRGPSPPQSGIARRDHKSSCGSS